MALEHHGTALQCVLVSFTSIRLGVPFDNACTVQPGDHPFITRESYILYREPRLYAVTGH